MKKVAKVFVGIGMVSTVFLTTGCFGKFALTKKVYKFHDSLAGNDMLGKALKSAPFWIGLGQIVYGFTGFVDLCIFNLIEFWTGTNPLAMNSGQKETQIVERLGVKYEITATQNKFEIKQLNGKKAGAVESITFNPSELAWYNTSNDASIKIIQYKVENGELVSATYFGANGKTEVINETQLDKLFTTVAVR